MSFREPTPWHPFDLILAADGALQVDGNEVFLSDDGHPVPVTDEVRDLTRRGLLDPHALTATAAGRDWLAKAVAR